MAQILALGVRLLSEETLLQAKKTPLVVGGTRTQVLCEFCGLWKLVLLIDSYKVSAEMHTSAKNLWIDLI